MGKIVSLLFGINILFASCLCFWFTWQKGERKRRKWWLLPIGIICAIIGYWNIGETFTERSPREITQIEFIDPETLEEIKLQK